jgi:hypothetical protein
MFLALAFTSVLVPSLFAQPSELTLARAIAAAEGYGARGALPTRYHNPGDIKACGHHLRIGKGGHVIFRTEAEGWDALIHQIDKMVDGSSHYYNQDMTIQQIAKRYAGNYRVWAKNVCRMVGCTPNDTLADVLGLPPIVRYVNNKALDGII